LAVAFDLFEVVRLLARGCVAHGRVLLVAFMTTAEAAVDGLRGALLCGVCAWGGLLTRRRSRAG